MKSKWRVHAIDEFAKMLVLTGLPVYMKVIHWNLWESKFLAFIGCTDMSTTILFPYSRNSAHSLWSVLSFIRSISWKKTNLNKSEHDCFKLKCLLRLQWIGQLGGRMAALYLEVLGSNFRQSQLSLLGFVIVPTIFPSNFHDNTLLIRASSDFITSSPFSTHSTITIFHRLQRPTTMKDVTAKIPSKIVKSDGNKKM